MRRPRSAELTYAALRKHWVALLVAICGSEGVWGLCKEYLRSKFMEWAVSHLGDLATWLFVDPFSILTLATAFAVIALATMVGKESPPASLILRDDEAYYPASTISRRWKMSFYVVASVIVILIVFGFYKYANRKDITVEFHRAAFGELRARHLAAGVLFDLKVINIGLPTTTRNWGLAIKFTDGETGTCTLVEKDITGYYAFSPSNPAIVDTREIKSSELLSVSTASNPIPTGGAASGPVNFICADYARDTVGAPGTVLTLSLDDARGKHYTYKYSVPAKFARIIFLDEQEQGQ